MMTHERLVDLYRSLKDEPVLSVYLDVDQHDPAERDVWRRRLEQRLGEARKAVEKNGNDTGDFEAAWARLRTELEPFEGFVGGRGWVGFASAGSLHYAEALPVPMPDLVRWEKGIRVAPYMRGLKQHRPVVVVLADRQRARILVYRNGSIEEPEDLLADTALGDLTDVGTHKRGYTNRVQGPDGGGQGTTSGVRGETATDQAQRILEVSSDRMWKALGQAVAARAGSDGFVVIGGPTETSSRLSGYLPESFRARSLERSTLHFDMSAAEVRDEAEKAAHELSAAHHEALVDEVVDRARSGGKAVLGRDATERALREMRVDTLLVSSGFLREDPDFADRCAGTALLQHAGVEEVGSAGGERLDAEAGGIAARVRYQVEAGAESGDANGGQGA